MPATSFTVSTPTNPIVSLPGARRGTSIKAAVSTFVTESARLKSAGTTPSVYDILRVERTASQTEIKAAYRRLAKVYHPDLSGNKDGDQSDGCDFVEIRNAYETLSDPVARAVYDLSLGSSRRRCGPVGFSSGYCSTRGWETDQCW